MVKRRPAAFQSIRTRHRPFQLRAEQLKVYQLAPPFEGVALGRQLLQASINVKKPSLPSHPTRLSRFESLTNQISAVSARGFWMCPAAAVAANLSGPALAQGTRVYLASTAAQ